MAWHEAFGRDRVSPPMISGEGGPVRGLPPDEDDAVGHDDGDSAGPAGTVKAAPVDPLTIAASLGVYGSASTWIFNVMRELTIAAHGADAVHACFGRGTTQTLADPAVAGRHLVLKLHQTDADWPAMAARLPVGMVLSIRDPRDAVLSMMQRFGMPCDAACTAVFLAFRSVAQAAARPHLGLRYEARFFEDPNTVGLLARHLGLAVDAAEQARIFAAYRTEQVKAFGQTLDSLPPERLDVVGDFTQFDRVTHIHRRHIGDGRTGKWRDGFAAAERAVVVERMSAISSSFGYSAE